MLKEINTYFDKKIKTLSDKKTSEKNTTDLETLKKFKRSNKRYGYIRITEFKF